MQGLSGNRRSVFKVDVLFKVDVHLGEHPTVEEAIADWSVEVGRLTAIGREKKRERLQEKLDRLQERYSDP